MELNGPKIFFASGTATFINGPANLLNNDPKNPPDWIMLDIWTLESCISVDMLFSNAFLNFLFRLTVSNNSWGESFPAEVRRAYY